MDVARALRPGGPVGRTFRGFARDRAGGAVVLFGLAFPVALAFGGAAVEYTAWTRQRTVLQTAADVAALSAAKELTVGQFSASRTQAVAESAVRTIVTGQARQEDLVVRATSPDELAVIEVAVSQPREAYFSQFLGVEPGVQTATARAVLAGRRKLCVLALDPAGAETIHLKSNAWLTARDCDVHSNSASAAGVSSDSGILVSAVRTCSTGGFAGQGGFRGERSAGCVAVKDPLADRAAPAAGPCRSDNKPVIDRGSHGARHRLQPGTYCGGLFIGGNSVAEFAPGEYVMKDGPLVVDSNADIRGDDVGFYLTGKDATFQFLSNARIDLDAPRTGALAGLLFFEDRAAPPLREHAIKTNYASNMTGTIYLPQGRFVVDATNDVAQQSAFTVIVGRRILLTANPKLVLNTNYGQTSVPVPPGLGQLGGEARLAD